MPNESLCLFEMEEEGIGQQRWAVDTTTPYPGSTHSNCLCISLFGLKTTTTTTTTTTDKYSATIRQIQLGQQREAVDTTPVCHTGTSWVHTVPRYHTPKQLPSFPLRSCNKHKTTTNKYSATIIQVQLLFILLLLSI